MDSFLDNRDKFSSELGFPDLYQFIDQFSLFAGAHTIGNKLWTYELLKQTVGVAGDILEFGSWNGANLMFLAKVNSLIEPNSPKKIIGFDNFSGLPKPDDIDGQAAFEMEGKYNGNEQILRKAISLFSLEKKVELIVGDACQTIDDFAKSRKEVLCSFAYLDFDLYEPSKHALKFLDDVLTVNGIIVFDQAGTQNWPGETIAMKEFLNYSSHEFQMLTNPISRQPTIALKRLK